ncbi:MAG: hypothetical protein IKX26_04480 [Bacteroidales bacterium]|nr:hypothetical protein [Bacteroidales bacterium]
METRININRKDLIQKYLDAETSVEEERLLAESFDDNPPVDKDEEKVAAILSHTKLLAKDESEREGLPEDDIIAEEEFDRIITRQRISRIWGYSIAGLAAAIALFFLLRTQAAEPQNEIHPANPVEQVPLLSDKALEDAEKCEFEPIEGGYILTAYFPDGSKGKYLLSQTEEDQSFFLISLNSPVTR